MHSRYNLTHFLIFQYAEKSELYRLTKNWFNFYQNHRGISPEQIVSIPNTESRPYRILIPIIQGLRFQTVNYSTEDKRLLI